MTIEDQEAIYVSTCIKEHATKEETTWKSYIDATAMVKLHSNADKTADATSIKVSFRKDTA